MEFIILTLGYFILLGGMLYKGADIPSLLGAAGVFVSSYFGLRRSSSSHKEMEEDDGK